MADAPKPCTWVLLPGMDGTGTLFGPFLTVLPAGVSARVVRYPANEVLSLDQLVERVRESLPKRDDFLLLGESFGGLLAARIAADNPPNLRAVVLSAAFPASPTSLFRPFHWLISPRFFKTRPPERVMDYLLAGSPCPLPVRDRITNVILSVKPEVMADRLRTILRANVHAALKRSKMPLLYLQGKRDKLVTSRSHKAIIAARPDTQTVLIDAPHFLLQTHPKAALDAVERFLDNLKEP
jgi:pimeloyl-[acyl-carrier protein] methyl ester esterase